MGDDEAADRYDRLGPGDLTMLLVDRGRAPMNTGAVLVFDDDQRPAPSALLDLLAERVVTVPRLRQRVQGLPWGCGPPVWVDDAAFTTEHHLLRRELGADAGPQDLLDLAADLLCRRLAPGRPPWLACAVVDPADEVVTALVFVAHHVLADGLGGLAVLGALADPGVSPSAREFPRRRPSYPALALEAARRRLRAAAGLGGRLRAGAAGLTELGLHRHVASGAGRTSLTRPTAGRRRLRVVRAPLADVVATARAAGGTVNDVVLAAVTGAMLAVLHERGEAPRRLVVSVPVSARLRTDARHLGNQTGVRPVVVPAVDDDRARLDAVVTASRGAAASARASSAGPLGFAFRLLGRLGLFVWFVDHQRLVDTFETNMRGPAEPLRIGGGTLGAVIPMAVNPGNVGVSFDTLSYAGTLGITVVADPDVVPDLDLLARSLSDSLARMCPARGWDAAGGPLPEDGGPGATAHRRHRG